MYAINKNAVVASAVALFVLLAINGASGLKCQFGSGTTDCESGYKGCFKAICGLSSGKELSGCHHGGPTCDASEIKDACQKQAGTFIVKSCWTCQGDMCNEGDKPPPKPVDNTGGSSSAVGHPFAFGMAWSLLFAVGPVFVSGIWMH